MILLAESKRQHCRFWQCILIMFVLPALLVRALKRMDIQDEERKRDEEERAN